MLTLVNGECSQEQLPTTIKSTIEYDGATYLVTITTREGGITYNSVIIKTLTTITTTTTDVDRSTSQGESSETINETAIHNLLTTTIKIDNNTVSDDTTQPLTTTTLLPLDNEDTTIDIDTTEPPTAVTESSTCSLGYYRYQGVCKGNLINILFSNLLVLFLIAFCISLECSIFPVTPNARIVGGLTATTGSWPAQVYILQRKVTAAGIFTGACGGTLINEMTILTAAHCVTTSVTSNDIIYPILFETTYPTYESTYRVVLGAQDVSNYATNVFTRPSAITDTNVVVKKIQKYIVVIINLALNERTL